MEDKDPIFCQYCKKEITTELADYGTCHICKKPILFECKECHLKVVHKDYVPPEIVVNITKPDFSENSRAQGADSAMKAAKQAIKLPWWNYYE